MNKAFAATAEWRTARACTGGQCIQVAAAGDDGAVMIRDSKNPDGSILHFSAEEWSAFLHGARSGDFDDLS